MQKTHTQFFDRLSAATATYDDDDDDWLLQSVFVAPVEMDPIAPANLSCSQTDVTMTTLKFCQFTNERRTCCAAHCCRRRRRRCDCHCNSIGTGIGTDPGPTMALAAGRRHCH